MFQMSKLRHREVIMCLRCSASPLPPPPNPRPLKVFVPKQYLSVATARNLGGNMTSFLPLISHTESVTKSQPVCLQNISGIFQLSLAPVPLPLLRPLSLSPAFLLPTRSTCLLSPPQIHSLHEARRIFLKHKLGCHSATSHLSLPLPLPSRESQTVKPTSSYGFQDPSPACLCVFPYSPSPSELP